MIKEWLKEREIRKHFPKEVKKWWAYGNWYMLRGDLHPHKEYRSDYIEYPIEEKFMFNPFNTIGGDADLIDGLIPAYRYKGFIGLYSIDGGYYSLGDSMSDWASWDNGKSYDLKLKKIITLEEFNKVFPPRLIYTPVNCDWCKKEVNIRDGKQSWYKNIYDKESGEIIGYFHRECHEKFKEIVEVE